MEERVVLTAEMRDEMTAPLNRVTTAVRSATRVITGASREQATAATGSSTTIMTALGRVGTGVTGVGTTFNRLTGVTRTAFTGVRNAITSAGGGIGAAARRVGDLAGSNVSDGMASKLKGVVGRLLAPLAVGAVVGMAVSGGIARQINIEDAEAKLTGLGNSTKDVAAIMANAMEAVNGTAFGMGDAATVAAGAVASGIKPGAELTRVLSLTADAATISGRSMSDMGSIFNKVAASGKLQGEVIAQLQDSGVPILQMVAKEMGVTVGEAQKMATAGEINFEIFSNAMEKGLGGAALKSGNTTKGALANMKASFSRFGVVLTGWFMPTLKYAFNAVGAVMNMITKALTPLSNAFGAAFQGAVIPMLEKFTEKVKGVTGTVTNFITGMFKLLKTGDFTGEIGKLLNVEEDAPIVGVLLTLASYGMAVTDTFWRLFGAANQFRIGLSMTSQQVVDAGSKLTRFQAIGYQVKTALSGIDPHVWQVLGAAILVVMGVFGKFMPLLSPLFGLFATLGPIVSKLGGVLGFLTGPLGIIIALLAVAYATSEPFREAINGLMGSLMDLGMQLLTGLMPVFTALMDGVMPVISSLFAALVPILISIVTALTPIITALLGQLLPIFLQLVDALLPPLMSLFEMLAGVLVTLLTALMPIIPPIMEIVSLLLNLAMQIITPLIPLVSLVAEMLGAVLGGAISLLMPIITFLVEALVTLVTFLKGPLGEAIKWVGGLFEGIGKIIDKVVGSVKDFFSNPLGGLQDMMGIKKNSGGGVYSGGGVVGFAGGGVTGGYAPGVDSIPAMLSPGESVLVPELTRALGPNNIMAANRAASGGRPAGSGPSVTSGYSEAASRPLGSGGGEAGGDVMVAEGAVKIFIDTKGAPISDGDLKRIEQAVNAIFRDAKKRSY